MAATASMSTPNTSQLSSAVAGPSSKRTKPIRVPPKISLGELTPNNIGTLRRLNSVLFPVAYSDRFYKEVLSPELEDYCRLVFYNDIPVGAICCRIERDEVPVSASEGEGSDEKAKGPAQPTGRLYLMTLGVLAPYRRQGLASKLLAHVMEKATEASLAASLTPAPSAVAPPTPAAAAVPVPASSAKADKKSGKNKGKAAANNAASAAAAAAAAEEAAKKAAAEAEAAEAAKASPPPPILRNIFVHVQTNNGDAKTFWEKNGFTAKETIEDYYKKNIEGPRDAWLLEKAIAN